METAGELGQLIRKRAKVNQPRELGVNRDWLSCQTPRDTQAGQPQGQLQQLPGMKRDAQKA